MTCLKLVTINSALDYQANGLKLGLLLGLVSSPL